MTDGMKSQILLSGLIITAIIFVILNLTSGSPEKTEDRTTDAKICAINVVENNLKAPSTAEHPKYSEMTARHIEGNKYKIYSYVDAENGFGAMVRTNYVVTLELTESGYKNASVEFSE